MSESKPQQFQAEIQQLLDIVIHSLYTDRDICLRELLSNGADACEKFRFLQAAGGTDLVTPDLPLTISVATDEKAGTLIITDTGVGMTRDELVENLGTIAHSGTKAFLKQFTESQKPDARLIGQFGVGFYSAFMVAKKVTVQTRSCRAGESAWRWTSEGANGYSIEQENDLPRGTRVTLELKDDAKDFAGEHFVESLIKRYSNFVQFPIDLNGKRLNTVQAIWTRNRSEIKPEEYEEFYKYSSHDAEPPLFYLHFSADAPLSLQAVLFVPAKNLETLGYFRSESEVHLYSRKVLIDAHPKGLLPDWLRFVRGVVDSEDLPLNVSRERMQDSQLLGKLNRALTSRFIKFLVEQSEKEPDKYQKFYSEHQRFVKEGALNDWNHRDDIAGLLRFESSALEPGKRSSLSEYVKRMPPDQKEIYYLLGGSRPAAESSPYFEVFRQRKFEVLFLDEPIDEFIFDRLPEFEGKIFRAAEKAQLQLDGVGEAAEALPKEAAVGLAQWLKESLGERVNETRVSERLVESPAVVVDPDKQMTATMRRTLRLMGREPGAAGGVAMDLEINPRHPLIARLEKLRPSQPELAGKVAAQLLDNARMAAGVLEDPREMIGRLNDLLSNLLDPTATSSRSPLSSAVPGEPGTEK